MDLIQADPTQTTMASLTPSVYEEFFEEKRKRKPVPNRKLMRWNPDVDQLVLLFVDHVCTKQGIAIPWDDIAKDVEPWLSGEAIKQHLAKVRAFREKEGRAVPEKLDKTTRRRAGKLTSGAPTTPAKGGRGWKAKNEAGEDEELDTPANGGNLLWRGNTKKGKAKKDGGGEDSTPKTPGKGRGGGRKKSKAANDDEGDENLETPNKSTGKRGRKAKKEVDDEDMCGSEDESPTKKQKTISLRPLTGNVNYNEQCDPDEDVFDAKQEGDDDGDYEDYGEADTMVKQESRSSQGSSIYNHPPPPAPAFAAPAYAGQYQDYSPQQNLNYRTSNYATAYGHNNYAGQVGMNNNTRMMNMDTFVGNPSMMAPDRNDPSNYQPGAPYGPPRAPYEMVPNNFNRQVGSGYGVGLPNQQTLMMTPQASSRSSTSTGPLAPVQDEEVNVNMQKTKSARKDSTRKTKKSPKKKPQQEVRQNSGYAVPQKVESEIHDTAATSANMEGSRYGDIPIMNDTGAGHANMHNYSASNNTTNAGLQNATINTGLQLNTNFNQGSEMMLTASPEELYGVGAHFVDGMGGQAHYHAMGAHTNYNSNSQQDDPMLSHTNNFASTVNASPTDEAMAIGFPHSQPLDGISNELFGGNDYDQIYMDDEFGNHDTFPFDGFNDLIG